MALTAYYFQRLSDGAILLGSGPNSMLYNFDPYNWGTLTGTQLDSAHWVQVDTAQPYRTYEYILNNYVDSFPRENGDWQQDLFRLLPVIRTL